MKIKGVHIIIRRWAIILFAGVQVWSCARDSQPSDLVEVFEKRAADIAKIHIPDRALDVYAAELVHEDNAWALRGESTVPDARQAVEALADSLLGTGTYRNSFLSLPDPALGDSTYGLVIVSVTPLRDAPKHSAQIIDQTQMGQTLRVLRKQSGWYLCRTAYDYIGWVDNDGLMRTDAAGAGAWESAARARVSDLHPMVHSMPDENAEPVTDLVLNAMVGVEKGRGRWVKVNTPDGRSGFIERSSLDFDPPGESNPDRLRASIVQSARSMMGVPYLWGGNSTKGNDCSGFTQIVFKANGIQLPRDSRQQALVGKTVVPDETWSNVLAGDLLFFGNTQTRKVTHVGISLGGMQFIDQGGRVKVNSMDSTDVNYHAYRYRTFLKIQRILED